MEPCHICGVSNPSVRPFGAGRKPICIDCAHNDPERAAIANMYFMESRQNRPIVIPVSFDTAMALLDALASDCDCPACTARRAAESAGSKPSATAPMN